MVGGFWLLKCISCHPLFTKLGVKEPIPYASRILGELDFIVHLFELYPS